MISACTYAANGRFECNKVGVLEEPFADSTRKSVYDPLAALTIPGAKSMRSKNFVVFWKNIPQGTLTLTPRNILNIMERGLPAMLSTFGMDIGALYPIFQSKCIPIYIANNGLAPKVEDLPLGLNATAGGEFGAIVIQALDERRLLHELGHNFLRVPMNMAAGSNDSWLQESLVEAVAQYLCPHLQPGMSTSQRKAPLDKEAPYESHDFILHLIQLYGPAVVKKIATNLPPGDDDTILTRVCSAIGVQWQTLVSDYLRSVARMLPYTDPRFGSYAGTVKQALVQRGILSRSGLFAGSTLVLDPQKKELYNFYAFGKGTLLQPNSMCIRDFLRSIKANKVHTLKIINSTGMPMVHRLVGSNTAADQETRTLNENAPSVMQIPQGPVALVSVISLDTSSAMKQTVVCKASLTEDNGTLLVQFGTNADALALPSEYTLRNGNYQRFSNGRS